MPSKFYVPILLGGMILTGSSNSLFSKWQDMQCVENCDDPNPANRVVYEQPVWQTLQMFLGEMLCFLPVLYTWLTVRYGKAASPQVQLPPDEDARNASEETPLKPAEGKQLAGWNVLVFWVPALCDLTGTTLMNIGLLYTPVSIYQMTRGALVLFVGVFSVFFLRRRLWFYQWFSLLVVIFGVGLVGYSGSLIKDSVKDALINALNAGFNAKDEIPSPEPIESPELTKVVVGVFFVLFAQIFTATQFVVEEKIMERYAVEPLVAVGWEGFFGTLSVLLMFPILAIPAVTRLSTFFDLPRGWHQMVDNSAVLGVGILVAFSISFFNFFGLSVTRHVSATARSLTDTCRTLSIWLISLGLGWEKLLFPISLLQVAGFGLLVYGTFLFNNLVKIPSCLPKPTPDDVPRIRVTDDEEGNEESDLLLSTSISSIENMNTTAELPTNLGRSGYDVLRDGERHAGQQGQHR